MIETFKTAFTGAIYFTAYCLTFAVVLYFVLVIRNLFKIYYDVWKQKRAAKRIKH